MAINQSRAKKLILEKLEETRIIEVACKKAGISRATFYRWRDEDEEFALQCAVAIEIGTDRISDLAESQLVSKIKAGDASTSKYWLEHHHPDYKPYNRFREKDVADPFAGYTQDQLERIIAITSVQAEKYKEEYRKTGKLSPLPSDAV
jgi:hypothetical protein